jgi:hypothetical protein
MPGEIAAVEDEQHANRTEECRIVADPGTRRLLLL